MKEYTGKILKNGPYQYWFMRGNLNSEGRPTVICADGTKFWYENGKCHRNNGPAHINADGTQYWYKHGMLHREDGPAVIRADGTKRWYKNGKRFYPETKPLLGKEVIIDGVSYILR